MYTVTYKRDNRSWPAKLDILRGASLDTSYNSHSRVATLKKHCAAGHNIIWLTNGIFVAVNGKPVPEQFSIHKDQNWCDAILVDKSCTLEDFELVESTE